MFSLSCNYFGYWQDFVLVNKLWQSMHQLQIWSLCLYPTVTVEQVPAVRYWMVNGETWLIKSLWRSSSCSAINKRLYSRLFTDYHSAWGRLLLGSPWLDVTVTIDHWIVADQWMCNSENNEEKRKPKAFHSVRSIKHYFQYENEK